MTIVKGAVGAMLLGLSVAAGAAALSSRDSEFVNKAALGGMKEVELSKLAEQQAANPQLKEFAATMVKDHGAANDKLASLAHDKGWTLPAQPDAAAKAAADALHAKKGADFDQAYIADMVKDHDEAVALFKAGANASDDAAVGDFAKSTLPTIEHHDAMAKALHGKIH